MVRFSVEFPFHCITLATCAHEIHEVTTHPRDLGAQLAATLRSGESLVWRGSPDPAIRFTLNDALLIPFALVMVLFSAFLTWLVWTVKVPALPRGLSLMFLFLGLYLLVGRFAVSARRKRKTVYAVTTQRALIIDDRGKLRTRELAEIVLDVVTSERGRAVTVHFRRRNSRRPTDLDLALDNRLTAVPLGSGFSLGSRLFLFSAVSDVAGLLTALKMPPPPSSSISKNS